MSRLDILVKNAHNREKVPPIPGRSYRYLDDGLEKGLLTCKRVGINGRQNKQLRYQLVQHLWEGVPCLA